MEIPFHTGWDKQHGGLFYFLDVDGHCPTQVRLYPWFNVKFDVDKNRPTVGQLSFWCEFHTIGANQTPSVAFWLIERVFREKSLWLADQLSKPVHKKKKQVLKVCKQWGQQGSSHFTPSSYPSFPICQSFHDMVDRDGQSEPTWFIFKIVNSCCFVERCRLLPPAGMESYFLSDYIKWKCTRWLLFWFSAKAFFFVVLLLHFVMF